MINAEKIADVLGRREMAGALGVGSTAISNAVVKGKFPSSWYIIVRDMCCGSGIDCPPRLFQMKSTDGVLSAADSGEMQEVRDQSREYHTQGGAG